MQLKIILAAAFAAFVACSPAQAQTISQEVQAWLAQQKITAQPGDYSTCIAGDAPDAICSWNAAHLGTQPTNDQLASAWTAQHALGVAQATYAATLQAGLAISCASGATVCASTIAGTYAVNPTISTQVDGVYAGIKGGDGLPGGGSTFNWPDAAGAMHAFTAAQFEEFARAYRDFVYNATQAEASAAAGGSPTWPSNSVQLP